MSGRPGLANAVIAASAVLLGCAVVISLLAGVGCGREERTASLEAPPPSPTAPAPAVPEKLAPLVDIRKEDLDRMVERRQVRLLVSYGATSYFVDRGSQGGWSFEAGRLLEQELNRRFRPGARLIHVVFVPVTRDQLLPALLEGRGDVAAANLTETSARSAKVAFSTPFFSDAREVVVTPPTRPPSPGRKTSPGARSSCAPPAATPRAWPS